MPQIEFIPTPVFEANERAYYEGQRVICNEGGSRCFAPDTLVYCDTGTKKISEIKPGDKVRTPSGVRNVVDVFKNDNKKPCVRIKLKSGKEIVCTKDHKFFFRGRWIEIEKILSLWDESNTGI